MANQNIPNDPYDPSRSGLCDDSFRARSRFDTELQADPELQEGPASSGKIALFALGIALVLGAVFYGLNNTSVHEAQTTPPDANRPDPASQPGGAPSGHARRDAAAEHPAGHHDRRGAEQPDAAAVLAAGRGQAVTA